MDKFIKWTNCKKKIDKNIENEVIKLPQESFRMDYFLYIVDKTIITLQNRFEQFKIYEYIFGFLFSIKNLRVVYFWKRNA